MCRHCTQQLITCTCIQWRVCYFIMAWSCGLKLLHIRAMCCEVVPWCVLIISLYTNSNLTVVLSLYPSTNVDVVVQSKLFAYNCLIMEMIECLTTSIYNQLTCVVTISWELLVLRIVRTCIGAVFHVHIAFSCYTVASGNISNPLFPNEYQFREVWLFPQPIQLCVNNLPCCLELWPGRLFLSSNF